MILLWLGVGIIAVTYAYLSAPNAIDPWEPLDRAGVVAAAYLIVLLLSTLRPPISRTIIIAGWLSALLFGGAVFFAWSGADTQSHYQAGAIADVRERISRGTIAVHISAPLLETLERYYAQSGPRPQPIGSLFRDVTRSAVGSNLHTSAYESDQLSIIVAALNTDEVILIAQEGTVQGRDPTFRNLDGGRGMIQELARLTPKGIVYESQN